MKKSSIIYSVVLVTLLFVFASSGQAQNTSSNSIQIKTGFVSETGLLNYTILSPLERAQMLTVVLAPLTPIKKTKNVYTSYSSSSQMSMFNPNYKESNQDLANQKRNDFVVTPLQYKPQNGNDKFGLARLGYDILSGAFK